MNILQKKSRSTRLVLVRLRILLNVGLAGALIITPTSDLLAVFIIFVALNAPYAIKPWLPTNSEHVIDTSKPLTYADFLLIQQNPTNLDACLKLISCGEYKISDADKDLINAQLEPYLLGFAQRKPFS